MTGPEHYREAQRFAEASVYAYQKYGETGHQGDFHSAIWQQAQGNLHATLALAAATAAGANMMHADQIAWERVSGAVLDIDGQQR